MDELDVVACRMLLDALDALGVHGTAVILVGAQAVYLRVGEADLAIAPYTTHGDLAIDPARQHSAAASPLGYLYRYTLLDSAAFRDNNKKGGTPWQ